MARSMYILHAALPDRPGMLAKVARALADRSVNIQGFVVDHSGIHLLVADIGPSMAALQSASVPFSAQAVHEVILEDRPGALAEMCERLASRGVNIVNGLGLATANSGRIYVSVDDAHAAAPIIDQSSNGPSLIHGRLGRIPPPTV